jgi:hypothetical protein
MKKTNFFVMKLLITLILLLGQGLGWSKEPARPRSIALPNQSIATRSGIQGGLAMGRQSRSPCNSLTIWNSRFQYFYSETISGGGAVRILGGDIDEKNGGTINRYYLNTRINHSEPNTAFYFGPILSLDNTNLSNLRSFANFSDEDLTEANPYNASSICQDVFNSTGLHLGLESGLGWRISTMLFFTSSLAYDYSFRHGGNYDLSFGFAIDLSYLYESIMLYTKGSFLHFEFNSRIDINRLESYQALFLGNSIAF